MRDNMNAEEASGGASNEGVVLYKEGGDSGARPGCIQAGAPRRPPPPPQITGQHTTPESLP